MHQWRQIKIFFPHCDFCIDNPLITKRPRIQMYLFWVVTALLLWPHALSHSVYMSWSRNKQERSPLGRVHAERRILDMCEVAKPSKKNKATPGDAPTADWPSHPPAGPRWPIAAQSAGLTREPLNWTPITLRTCIGSRWPRHTQTDRRTDSRGWVPAPEQRLV